MGRFRRRRCAPVLLCQIVDDRLEAILLRSADSLGDPSVEPWTSKRPLPPRSQVVLLLPRSEYLIRVLELPPVEVDEVAQMLRLEIEATLPREFGDTEVAYRRLNGATATSRRYEVYAVRRESLAEHLKICEQHDVQPDCVFPTAVLWARHLGHETAVDVLAVATKGGNWELATVQGDGQVASRTIGAHGTDAATLQTGLVEYLRPLLDQRGNAMPALRVGWLGGVCPAASNGRVVFESLTDLLVAPDVDEASSVAPLLALGATTLNDMQRTPELGTANLLPQWLQQHRLERSSLRAIATIACCALLGLVLVGAALQVAVVRYHAHSAGLGGRITAIQKGGEAVGRQLEQLEAVQRARATRGDLQRVLSGLYEGTPEEVSYNHVELGREGHLRLRGQAESLSMPFVLPERLEPLPMFQHVVLRDASQSRRGQGSVVEFHMEIQLVREEASR